MPLEKDVYEISRGVPARAELDEYGVARWVPGVLPRLAATLDVEDLPAVDLPGWFKFPVNLTSGSPIQPAFDFLAVDVLARGDRARETNQARAYDLRSFFEFTALEGMSWTETDQSFIERFVLDMVCVSVAAGESGHAAADEVPDQHHFDDDLQLSVSSVSRRLDTIKGLFRYARQGDVPFDTSFAKKAGRHPKQTVRPVPPERISLLLDAAGPPPSKRKAGQSSRLWCACVLALLAGLRRIEICGLDIDQISSIVTTPTDPSREYAIELRVTKGGRLRAILLPGWFIDELKNYIDGERGAGCDKDGVRPSGPLFVNHARARRNPLGRYTPATLSYEFRLAALNADLRRQNPLFRHGTGTSARLHTFHDLRHTCACLFYVAERQHSADPWIEVQNRLGHRLLKTTVQVYLRFIKDFLEGDGREDVRQVVVRGLIAA